MIRINNNRFYFHIKSLFLIALSFVAISTYARAANSVDQEKKSLDITHTIKSRFPEMDRTVSVHLPPGYYEQSGARYPVLYILDGENNLEFTTSAISFLAKGGQIPQIIIVGLHSDNNRGIDYPPNWAAANSQGEQPVGANLFLDYIEKELLPFIDTSYRTTRFRLLSGHSLGGLFATYAMTQKPDLFAGHFAQSPALNRSIFEAFYTHLSTFLAQNPELESTYFITLGDEPNFAPNFNKVIALLEEKSPKNLAWNASFQANRAHMETRMIGIYEAVERLFASDWPLTRAAKSGNVSAHIKALTAKYGIKARYDSDAYAGAIQTLLSKRNISAGTEMAKAFVAQYPKSAFARFLIVNAHIMGKNNKEAIKEINIARKLIEEAGPEDRALQELVAPLNQLEKRASRN